MSSIQPRAPRLIGYVRTVLGEEPHGLQIDDLRAAGCDRIFEEHGTSASRNRHVLTRLLGELSAGDVLIVVRLDRLGLSSRHLLPLMENLEQRGVQLRSIGDRLDTTPPNGAVCLAMVRAIVSLEKALTGERTRAGIQLAKGRGRLAGNPGLRDRRPDAIKALSRARDKIYLDELMTSAESWLPTVQQLRPDHSWDNIVRVLNRRGMDWTTERLRRAVHRLAREKLADPGLLVRSPRRGPQDRLMTLISAIALADPGLSLRGIAAQLDLLGEKPIRGGRKWQPSSVRHFLEEARRFGLIRS